MDVKPAIVVITFNRPKSLKRLLKSLEEAYYEEAGVPLVISIDYQNTTKHTDVVDFAENFVWKYGEKRIIKHSENLGLRKHVLTCGDLVNDYESIIMLEDDLFVSPEFYNYTTKALTFYKNEDKIGGISLYTHKKNFLNKYPFETISDSNDVFFLQIASSWGQAWTKKQWNGFREWLEGQRIIESDPIPIQVKNWPETSWLKFFIKYLVFTDKYFVYPTASFSTNFGDSGTHNRKSNVVYQVPFFLGKEIRFIEIEKSINVYDAFFEILPSRLKRLSPALEDIEFSVDLYGEKVIENIKTEYLISSKKNRNQSAKYFGLEVKPMVLNLVYKIEGEVFSLDSKYNFNELTLFDVSNEEVFNYLFSSISIKKLTLLLANRVRNKIKK
ncbi:hypothetical protein [Algibacter sp. Ld11]|uniref:hypothetical protein n=1 Tax=Algibacter sp. Ld11 TaxID=649150 RepID=UPI00386BE96D